MPNILAYVMLLAWPLIAVALFRRLPAPRALIWSILGAYLLLPPVANFDLPLLPALDKTTIPNIAAFAVCASLLGKGTWVLPVSPAGRILVVLFVLSPIGTILTNTDPISFGPTWLPGMQIQDAVAIILNQAILLAPLLLARRLLATQEAQRDILAAFVLAGLVYSLPMLVEIRLSPQINVWVYGFFQHSFEQMMREGGFRPIVFLPHGLWVAFFALTTLVAAITLWRAAEPERRTYYLMASGYLGVLLVLCKSLGVLVYASVLVPLMLFAGRKTQIRLAAALALVALCYPLLRGAELVPVETMVVQAAAIDEERAASLQFRFDNEEILLERARERGLFGWGGWDRNSVYDPETGRNISTIDGRWIIVIGIFGWFGYISEFGLLVLPLILLARQTGRIPIAEISPYAAPLALILAFNITDMLPNATLIPFTWLLAGALFGHAETIAARAKTLTMRTWENDDPHPISGQEEKVKAAKRTII